MTGERITIFVDRNDIRWGDEWRTRIDGALASGTFLISIVTPRYFQSEECSRELNSFARRAEQLGVSELVLPILYVDFAAFRADPPPDDAIALVKRHHWEDWTSLRFETLDSKAYRSAVARLAGRLTQVSVAVEEVDASRPQAEVSQDADEDDAPGFLDLVARAEEAMKEWKPTVEELGQSIEEIGNLTQAAADRIHDADARGKGFAGRLAVARSLAVELNPAADNIQRLGNRYASELNDIDSGVRAILARVPAEVENDPESISQLGDFFEVLRNLASSVDEGLGSLAGMVEAMGPVERDSRNLRPVLRKLRTGLTMLMDSRTVTNEWVDIIDGLEIAEAGL